MRSFHRGLIGVPWCLPTAARKRLTLLLAHKALHYLASPSLEVPLMPQPHIAELGPWKHQASHWPSVSLNKLFSLQNVLPPPVYLSTLTHPSNFSFITPPPGSLRSLHFFSPGWISACSGHVSTPCFHLADIPLTAFPSAQWTGVCYLRTTSLGGHAKSPPGSRAPCAVEHGKCFENLKLWALPSIDFIFWERNNYLWRNNCRCAREERRCRYGPCDLVLSSRWNTQERFMAKAQRGSTS